MAQSAARSTGRFSGWAEGARAGFTGSGANRFGAFEASTGSVLSGRTVVSGEEAHDHGNGSSQGTFA